MYTSYLYIDFICVHTYDEHNTPTSVSCVVYVWMDVVFNNLFVFVCVSSSLWPETWVTVVLFWYTGNVKLILCNRGECLKLKYKLLYLNGCPRMCHAGSILKVHSFCFNWATTYTGFDVTMKPIP